jgi:hypothetical protein
MNTKLLFASVTLASTAGLAGLASSAHAGGLSVGGQVQLIPVAELTIDDGDDSESEDLNTTVGFAGIVEYAVHPNVSIGFAPRFIIGLEPDGAEDSASQLDLSARITGRLPVAPKVDLFAYAAPGYSLIFPPDNDLIDFGTPSGFILGFGGGAAYKVTPTLSVVGEVGYSLGFQSTTVEALGQEADADVKTNLLHIGLGVQAAL